MNSFLNRAFLRNMFCYLLFFFFDFFFFFFDFFDFFFDFDFFFNSSSSTVFSASRVSRCPFRRFLRVNKRGETRRRIIQKSTSGSSPAASPPALSPDFFFSREREKKAENSAKKNQKKGEKVPPPRWQKLKRRYVSFLFASFSKCARSKSSKKEF